MKKYLQLIGKLPDDLKEKFSKEINELKANYEID